MFISGTAEKHTNSINFSLIITSSHKNVQHHNAAIVRFKILECEVFQLDCNTLIVYDCHHFTLYCYFDVHHLPLLKSLSLLFVDKRKPTWFIEVHSRKFTLHSVVGFLFSANNVLTAYLLVSCNDRRGATRCGDENGKWQWCECNAKVCQELNSCERLHLLMSDDCLLLLYSIPSAVSSFLNINQLLIFVWLLANWNNNIVKWWRQYSHCILKSFN